MALGTKKMPMSLMETTSPRVRKILQVFQKTMVARKQRTLKNPVTERTKLWKIESLKSQSQLLLGRTKIRLACEAGFFQRQFNSPLPFMMGVCVLSHSVVFNSLQPHRL